ncbi:hypothetical protein D3C76_1875800 [compost metagenome]
MFAHHEVTVLVLQVAPHAVEMDGVSHHGVVDQSEAKTLAILEAQGLCIRELNPIKRP